MTAHGLVAQLLQRVGDRGCPEIVVEDDGRLGFDWDRGRRCVISLSLAADGAVAWAALVGEWKATGTASVDEWSHALDEAFRRFDVEPQPVTDALRLADANGHLRYWWVTQGACPCGARRESPSTHPHVMGCPTGRAVA